MKELQMQMVMTWQDLGTEIKNMFWQQDLGYVQVKGQIIDGKKSMNHKLKG